MSDQKHILNLLLDRYERSRHLRAPGESARGVFLRLDRETLPEYWDEVRFQRRPEINSAVQELVARGLVSVRHSPYSAAEIERVDLNLAQIAAAYAAAGRVSRRTLELHLADGARGWAERWAEPADWRHRFAAAVASAAGAGARLPAGLRAAEPGVLEELCRLLEVLGPTGLAAEAPQRVLSQRTLGNSKRLEELKPRLLSCLREFWPGPLPEEDREALGELGIVENPQYVYLAGPVRLDSLDLGAANSAVGLPTAFLERCTVAGLAADRVITVENLTSFHQVAAALPPRTLAVYLGGYHNRARRDLLLKLAGAGVAEFRHWGDIDLGGFRIFVHLAERTGLGLQPLLMDLQTYRAHAAGGMAFSPQYGAELAALLALPNFAVFAPVIREMLALQRRVEQEAVAFSF